MRPVFTDLKPRESLVPIAPDGAVRLGDMAVNLGVGLRRIKAYDGATLETLGFQWIALP